MPPGPGVVPSWRSCAAVLTALPFDGYAMMWAQTYVPMSVAALAERAVEPQ